MKTGRFLERFSVRAFRWKQTLTLRGEKSKSIDLFVVKWKVIHRVKTSVLSAAGSPSPFNVSYMQTVEVCI